MKLELDLQNPNPYLADSRNKMFIRKVKNNSKVVWITSYLNKVGQPIGYQFPSLKLAKQHAEKIGIPFEVGEKRWII